MRTVYSITFPHPEGGTTVIDYLDRGGWWRHEFSSDGDYLEAAPTDVRALVPLAGDGGSSLVYELRKCAEAMAAATEVTADPAGKALRRDRRDVLRRLDWAVGLAWDDALRRVEDAPPDDLAAIARANRALEFMRSSRELARAELSTD